MMRLTILAAGAALCLTACESEGYLTTNRLLVIPTSPTEFTIPFRGLSGDSDFWCAAGDYVIRGLNMPPTTTIYRTSPPPRGGGEGIDFSLTPENAQDPGIAILSRGLGVSASFARNFCERRQRSVFDD